MSEKLAVELGSPAAPTPALQIPTTPAPGLRGQGSKNGGMAPRQTFAPVNVTTPPAPSAGAAEQKSISPPSPRMQAPAAPPPMASPPMVKMNSAKGNEGYMGTSMGTRPLRLQDMLKTAMAESSQKISVSNEAARQQVEETKTASVSTAEEIVDHGYALKLASAIEMVATQLDKTAADLGGPYNLTENKQEVGKGPGALQVMEAKASTKFPDHQGQGHNVVPMRTGTEKVHSQEHSATANETNMNSPAGFHSTQTTAMSGGKGKTAGVKVAEEKCSKCDKEMSKCACGGKTAAAKIKAAYAAVKTAAPETEKKETEGMEAAKKGLEKAEKAHESEPENKKEGSALVARLLATKTASKTKTAEDAINPAKIEAGKAVPPETSEAGQPGGAPVGGAGEGPKGLVGSNESAQHYKKNQAYAPRKAELGQYFNEPALTMSTDKTLAEAFEHTSQAGTKFASVGTGGSTKVAAAKAVLSKLAEQAGNTAKDPKGEKGAAPAA